MITIAKENKYDIATAPLPANSGSDDTSSGNKDNELKRFFPQLRVKTRDDADTREYTEVCKTHKTTGVNLAASVIRRWKVV